MSSEDQDDGKSSIFRYVEDESIDDSLIEEPNYIVDNIQVYSIQ